jgi:SAM-dependent methyltransferase
MNSNIPHNFDNIAFVYDTLASWVFGQSIKQAQINSISFIPDGATVLVIGGGSGWYLREVLIKKKPKRVLYLEASQKMLALTKKTIGSIPPSNSAVVELCLGTEESLDPGEKFDVVITHFFLDMYAPAPLEKVANKLYHSLNPQGLWLIADFRLLPQQTRWVKLWQRLLVKSMYLFFRRLCKISASSLPDFVRLFTALGMLPVYESSFYKGLIFSAAYARKSKYLP